MNALLGLADLAGYVTLLLWGTHMVTSGVQRGYGAWLRQALGRLLRRGRSAFGAGVAVTLALQSSTATSLMGATFVGEGLITLDAGYMMMLGANLGTALVARALSFPIAMWAPVGVLVGVLVFRRARTTRVRNLGRISIGLGLMLLALHWLVLTMDHWAQGGMVGQVLLALAHQPLLLFLVVLLLTWMCHSSVAVILLISALMVSHPWPVAAQMAVLAGANLGSAVSPFLEASGVEERRLPLGNLLVRALGVTLLGLTAPIWLQMPKSWPLTPDFLVNAHVVFNLMLAIIATPMALWFKKLVLYYLPDPVTPDSPSVPRYLEESTLAMPGLALAAAERETLRLSGLAEDLLIRTLDGIKDGDERLGKEVRDKETGISRLALNIRQYLARLPEDMRDEHRNRRQDIQHFLYHMEQMCDLLANSLVKTAVDQRKHRAAFSEEEWRILERLHKDLVESMHLAVAVFMKMDVDVARTLVARKPALRALENETLERRATELLEGNPVALRPGDALLAALRDFKRVHSHMTGLAYQVLEGAGQLRSRLVDMKPEVDN